MAKVKGEQNKDLVEKVQNYYLNRPVNDLITKHPKKNIFAKFRTVLQNLPETNREQIKNEAEKYQKILGENYSIKELENDVKEWPEQDKDSLYQTITQFENPSLREQDSVDRLYFLKFSPYNNMAAAQAIVTEFEFPNKLYRKIANDEKVPEIDHQLARYAQGKLNSLVESYIHLGIAQSIQNEIEKGENPGRYPNIDRPHSYVGTNIEGVKTRQSTVSKKPGLDQIENNDV